ncbi:MAG: Forkhead-associated protein [Clostridiales bacterium]|jgi:hypothetical protein|nr:Forkhead-associated protein [Clostridiales bacterium]
MNWKILRQLLLIDYESDLSSSYLVLRAAKELQIQHYQVEMIANNRDIGILPLDIRLKDSTESIYYNITSKLSLTQFLNRKKLKRHEFLKMLKYMVKGVVNSAGYLLSDKSFFLDEEYIFINPNTLEVSYVYIPIKLERDTREEFRELMVRLMVNATVAEENEKDNFLQRILNILKSDVFNIPDFEKLLTELGSNSIETPNINIERKQKYSAPIEQPNLKKQEIEKSYISNKKPDIVIPKNEKTVQKDTSSEQREPKGKTGIILLQVFMILVIVLSYATGALKSLGGDVKTTMAALAIVLGAVDFLVVKSLLDKSNRTELKSSKAPVAVPVSHKAPLKEDIKEVPERLVEKRSSSVTPQRSQQGNETEILSQIKKEHPFLQGKRKGTTEEVPITKSSFIIGRINDQVDHVSDNPAVGKVHAEIVTREGGYYLKDLNSRNGTFINDKKLDCNKEYPLNNYDKVTLANSEYTFIIPEIKL